MASILIRRSVMTVLGAGPGLMALPRGADAATAAKGEFVALLGGSGSGKSIVLNMIATLLAPSVGQVLIDG